MNNWGYLILIAALIVLTAFMLYARFAARSREKSLHHAPAESGTLRFDPVAETSEVPEKSSDRAPDPLVMDLKPLQIDADDEKEKKKSSKAEDTYFDELQEAAAGLAMLMRSSAAQERSGPVVYEPESAEVDEVESSVEVVDDDSALIESVGFAEEEAFLRDSAEVTEGETVELITEEAGEDAVELITADSADHEEIVAEFTPDSEDLSEAEAPVFAEEEPASEEIASMSEAMDHVEALLDDPPIFEGEKENFDSVEREADVVSESLESVLGPEVTAQLLAIDSGLDELESLVAGIESQLALLEDFISAPIKEEVSKAA